MQPQTFRTVIPAEQLQPVVTIPKDFAGQVLELVIRPVKKRRFRSIAFIKIDTKTFTFNRDEANAR